MKVLRTIVNKTRRDKIRNKTIRRQVVVVKLKNKINAAQQKWLGHLERMNDGRVAKKNGIGDQTDKDQ